MAGEVADIMVSLACSWMRCTICEISALVSVL
jgi:hypothetical protein